MGIIAKRTKTDFTPAPEGLWQAVCCDVIDLGEQDTPWGAKPKVEIRWQIDQKNPDNDNKPFMVMRRFTLSLHEKASLRSTLEAWRGRKFTDEELDGFDLEKLLGANCQVQVIHNPGTEGNVYANVQAVVPPPKGAVKMRVNGDYIRVIERAKRAEFEKNPNGNAVKIMDEDIPF